MAPKRISPERGSGTRGLTKKFAIRVVASVTLAVCTSAPLFAQLPKPTGTTAVLAGRLVDVRTGSVTTHKYIIVENDRIARIVDAAPSGVKVIDLSKFTVVPGLTGLSRSHVE